MNDVPKAVSIKELMVATGKGRSTIYVMIANGDLPGYRGKTGGVVVPRPWFEDWLHGRWVPHQQQNTTPITVIHSRKVS